MDTIQDKTEDHIYKHIKKRFLYVLGVIYKHMYLIFEQMWVILFHLYF